MVPAIASGIKKISNFTDAREGLISGVNDRGNLVTLESDDSENCSNFIVFNGFLHEHHKGWHCDEHWVMREVPLLRCTHELCFQVTPLQQQ